MLLRISIISTLILLILIIVSIANKNNFELFSDTKKELVNIITYRRFLFKDYYLIDVSTDQDVFTIESNLPNVNFQNLKQNTKIYYNDETSLYIFRILCVCYEIDPYNYFVFEIRDYEKYLNTFDNSNSVYIALQNKKTKFKKYMVKYADVSKDKLLFYIPFARFHTVETINNQYYNLLLLDKVYVTKTKTLSSSKDSISRNNKHYYCPYPDLADENIKNVYIKEGFTLLNEPINLTINEDLSRLGDIKYNLFTNTITILTDPLNPYATKYLHFLKEKDTIIISNQKINKWNGNYTIQQIDLQSNIIALNKLIGNNNLDDNQFSSKLFIKNEDMCYDDADCPFYNPNTGKGGCESGYCKMPVGIKRIGFKDFEQDKTPFCFGCIDDLQPRCCSDPERYFFL